MPQLAASMEALRRDHAQDIQRLVAEHAAAVPMIVMSASQHAAQPLYARIEELETINRKWRESMETLKVT